MTQPTAIAPDSDAYYVKLFIENPAWSAPAPNEDEAARWSVISRLLQSIVLNEGGFRQPIAGSSSSLSPSPRPSPRGEGERSPSQPNTNDSLFAETRTSILPLPKGEGRGEGEGTTHQSVARPHTPTSPFRILDVGCGRGWLTNLVSEFGDADGVEPVAPVIEQAKKLFPHLKFTAGTAETILASPDFRPYDLVVTSEVIEHVPRGEQPGFARTLARLLKPGGHVILTTPRGESLREWTQLMGDPSQPVEDWLREPELRDLFTSAQFTVAGHERVLFDIEARRYISREAAQTANHFVAIYQVWAFQNFISSPSKFDVGCSMFDVSPTHQEGQDGFRQPIAGSSSSLSPSPQPSLRGEGERSPSQPNTNDSQFAETRTSILPLPKGEGRGEGEGTTHQSVAPASPAASAPSPSMFDVRCSAFDVSPAHREQDGFRQPIAGSSSSLSPSPRPSPRGEGETESVSTNTSDSPVSETRTSLLPLPKGEGRGEGKGTAHQPKSSDSPQDYHPTSLTARASSLFASGQTEPARQLLAWTIALHADHAPARKLFAEVLRALGHQDHAEVQSARAAELEAPAPPVDANTFSFLKHLAESSMVEGARAQLEIRHAAISGRIAPCIYLHPPARLCFEVPFAEAGRFTCAIAIQPEAWNQPTAGGCEFFLRVDGREVFRQSINPRQFPAHRCWHEIDVEVPAVRGRAHEFIFRTLAVGSPPDFRWALWRDPVFRPHPAPAAKPL